MPWLGESKSPWFLSFFCGRIGLDGWAEEKSIAFPRLTLDGYAPFFGVMRNPGEWNSSLNFAQFCFRNILKPLTTEGFGTKVSAAKSDLSWGLLVNQMLDDSLFKVPKSQAFETDLFGSRSPFCPPKEILWWVLDKAGPWRIARHDTKASLESQVSAIHFYCWLMFFYLFGIFLGDDTNALRVFVRILWPCFGQAMLTCSHRNALHCMKFYLPHIATQRQRPHGVLSMLHMSMKRYERYWMWNCCTVWCPMTVCMIMYVQLP